MSSNPFDEAPSVSSDTLKKLLKMANELVKLEKEIEAEEAALKRKTGAANTLKLSMIPDAMAEAGLAEFKLPNGAQVTVSDFVSGSLPKDVLKRQEAIQYLTEIGGNSIIKNEIYASFEKKQHNEAVAAADALREQGFTVEVQASVHPQTLLAFVREKLRGGDPIEAEKLNVFVGRKAKVDLNV